LATDLVAETTASLGEAEVPPTPTAVLLSEQSSEEDLLPVLQPLPSPVSDPLRFVFPTPGPVPVSAWRPPLYPTPWAPTPYDHFFFSRPIAADEINWPLADYRYGGVFFPGVVHTGIDIPAPLETPVLAAGSGRVTWAGYGLYRGVEDPTDPYGLAVAIKHDFGFQGETLYTVYGHLNRVDVMVGQYVTVGEMIGISGETGKVTGPHLHFEVRIGKNNFFVSRNPELWLAPPQGWGILAARLMSTGGSLLEGLTVTIRSKQTNQTWYVKSYGQGTVNSDPYYRENMVIGDLPAGDYVIWLPYEGSTYNTDITITPGMVSYFSFRGKNGIKTGLPPTPTAGFTPPVETNTPTP
jgi:murein DD-endopeptidase MepM/ murein hydrolase activator NlpD